MTKVTAQVSLKPSSQPPSSRPKKALKVTGIVISVMIPLAALLVGILGVHQIAFFGAIGQGYADLLIKGGVLATGIALAVLAVIYARPKSKKVLKKIFVTEEVSFAEQCQRRKPRSPIIRPPPVVHFPNGTAIKG